MGGVISQKEEPEMMGKYMLTTLYPNSALRCGKPRLSASSYSYIASSNSLR